MATNYITIKGYIENGELKVDLPENVPDGEVEVIIPVSGDENGDRSEVFDEISWDTEAWTLVELDEMLTFQPSTLGEILSEGLVGGWEDRGITDSVEWVLEQRRKRRERRGNWTLS